MKKLFLLIAATTLLYTAGVQAQTKEDVRAAKARCEKLEKLKVPKASGSSQIDELMRKTEASSKESMEITPLLLSLYYRSQGQTAEGVADANVEKPTLAECTVLSLRIGKHAVAVKEAAEKMQGATSELKEIKNPLKLKSASSCMSYSTDALSIVGEESVFQSQLIAEIIKSIS